MKKLLLLLALSGCVAAGHAQEILLGTDFKMYFDNKEFGSNEFAVPGLDIESGTDFAARLTPRVGIRWDEKNTLVIAADMIKNFGTQESAYLSEIKPVFYYQFQTPKVTAAAGIFTRDMMHDDDYSTAFFSESERFFHNRMNGVLAQYNGKRNSYVEFVCDWEGMYSTLSREKFRILLAGRHYLDTFYYGFNYSMFHYAGQQGAPIENVVDLQLLNPCVGVRFNAFFDFDIKLGALLTAQRDRSFGHSWEKPCMASSPSGSAAGDCRSTNASMSATTSTPSSTDMNSKTAHRSPTAASCTPPRVSSAPTRRCTAARRSPTAARSSTTRSRSARSSPPTTTARPWEPSKCWSWG